MFTCVHAHLQTYTPLPPPPHIHTTHQDGGVNSLYWRYTLFHKHWPGRSTMAYIGGCQKEGRFRDTMGITPGCFWLLVEDGETSEHLTVPRTAASLHLLLQIISWHHKKCQDTETRLAIKNASEHPQPSSKSFWTNSEDGMMANGKSCISFICSSRSTP